MEQFIVVLVAMLMSITPFYNDNESSQEREDRMTIIATAIANTSFEATCSGSFDTEECVPAFNGTSQELSVGLFTVGFWESKFAKHIHKNKCRRGGEDKNGVWHRGECDEVLIGKDGKVLDKPQEALIGRRYFRARSMWQVQYEKLIKDEWNLMIGKDNSGADLFDPTSLEATTAATWAATKKFARCWPKTNIAEYQSSTISVFRCYGGARSKARDNHKNGPNNRAFFFNERMKQFTRIYEELNNVN